MAVEVKRRGEIDGVEQLTRYIERLERDPALRPVRGVFVAQSIKPQAQVLAERPRAFDASRSTTTCCAGCGPKTSSCSDARQLKVHAPWSMTTRSFAPP